MPELPEVEAVCRKLRPHVEGRRVLRMAVERAGIVRPQLPHTLEARLGDAVIEAVHRHGKNILLLLGGGDAIHVHLRMTGNLYVIPDVRFRPERTRVWWELEGGSGLIFEDSRALGRVHLLGRTEMERLIAGVGVEPLGEVFTLDWFIASAARSRKPAKLFLMDQRFIAGLGNIYAAEALFRARVHPARIMNSLRRPKVEALHKAIREVMEEAVASAALAYAEPGVFTEGENFACAVYDREGEQCLRCQRRVKRIPQGGRSTYFCPGCQR